MKTTRTTNPTLVLAACCFAALFACGADDNDTEGPDAGPIPPDLDGVWSGCVDAFGQDAFATATYNGDRVTLVITGFTSSDESCTGASMPAGGYEGTYVLGGPVSVSLGETTVTAWETETTVTADSFVFYDVIYVDDSVSPLRSFVGDMTGSQDGSTPALRPTMLLPFFLTKEP